MTENLKLATLDSFFSCLRKIFIDMYVHISSTLLQLKTKSMNILTAVKCVVWT